MNVIVTMFVKLSLKKTIVNKMIVEPYEIRNGAFLTYLVDRLPEPNREGFETQAPAFLETLVKRWELEH